MFRIRASHFHRLASAFRDFDLQPLNSMKLKVEDSHIIPSGADDADITNVKRR